RYADTMSAMEAPDMERHLTGKSPAGKITHMPFRHHCAPSSATLADNSLLRAITVRTAPVKSSVRNTRATSNSSHTNNNNKTLTRTGGNDGPLH
ncbi:MAG: hypothetical protein OIF57_16745, partial [Marinobacterium sp.]|nr:hypothetical protein [Marinobacterium sp.]